MKSDKEIGEMLIEAARNVQMAEQYQPMINPGKVEGVKYDHDKARMDLLPFGALDDIARVLSHGARKYAPDNWKKVPDPIPRYEAAMLRHISAYKQGEILDKESGLPHLAHAGCCLLFLLHFTKKDVDTSSDMK